MKKLLTAAAVVAAATTFAPAGPPAGAANGHPDAGDTLLCTLDYQSAKQWTFGGSVLANSAFVDGTCTSLTSLQSFTVTTPPFNGGGGGYECVATASLNMTIGNGRYFSAWVPVVSTVDLPLGIRPDGSLPVVAAGSVVSDGAGIQTNSGFAALVGSADCGMYKDTVQGSMVMTLTVGEPYAIV